MRRYSIVLSVIFSFIVLGASGQSRPAHPVHFYDFLGKNASWVDRNIRADYGVKLDKEKISKDSVIYSMYNDVSDVKVSFYLVDDRCDYIAFDDYHLNNNNINTYFTQWCTDVTDHYTFVADKQEKYPMFTDTSFNVVFFIPDEQTLDNGLRYFLFSGFIHGEQLLTKR